MHLLKTFYFSIANYLNEKACGVVVRASASHLGELSSNLTSAKIFINDLVELGPTQILHPRTGVKAGRGDF